MEKYGHLVGSVVATTIETLFKKCSSYPTKLPMVPINQNKLAFFYPKSLTFGFLLFVVMFSLDLPSIFLNQTTPSLNVHF